MRATLLAATAAAALALTGCQSMMGERNTSAMGASAMGGDMTPEMAMPYVMMAGASDMFEIESSRLALQRAQRPETRQYAQMLVQHHMQTSAQVMAAARASGLNPPPPRLMPMQQQMMAELQRASAGNFDMVYLRQQVPAHEMALALHRNYAASGDRPPLRTVAGTAVPIVTQHLQQARTMMR